jgi:6-phosphogluconate dehydrogenase (decarboxylating)
MQLGMIGLGRIMGSNMGLATLLKGRPSLAWSSDVSPQAPLQQIASEGATGVGRSAGLRFVNWEKPRAIWMDGAVSVGPIDDRAQVLPSLEQNDILDRDGQAIPIYVDDIRCVRNGS